MGEETEVSEELRQVVAAPTMLPSKQEEEEEVLNPVSLAELPCVHVEFLSARYGQSTVSVKDINIEKCEEIVNRVIEKLGLKDKGNHHVP